MKTGSRATDPEPFLQLHGQTISKDSEIKRLKATIGRLTDALERIMPYANTGASVTDVYVTDQPEFVKARDAIAEGKSIK